MSVNYFPSLLRSRTGYFTKYGKTLCLYVCAGTGIDIVNNVISLEPSTGPIIPGFTFTGGITGGGRRSEGTGDQAYITTDYVKFEETEFSSVIVGDLKFSNIQTLVDEINTIMPTPVQSDWNESVDTSLAYIQNKPTNLEFQSDFWLEINPASLAYIHNKPTKIGLKLIQQI